MQLPDLFANFSSTAFRLEGFPEYRVPEEVDALEEFNKTGQILSGHNADWAELVSNKVREGKSMTRLRLLSEELTTYEKFELGAYEAGHVAGEDIRIAQRAGQPFEGDFWLFDNRWVARMNYDAHGAWLGADITEVTDNDLETLRHWALVYATARTLRDSEHV